MSPPEPPERSEARCSLLPFVDTPGVCDACGTVLTERRRRWCSRRCNYTYATNHRWTLARKAARRRDREKCTTCGSGENLEVNHIVPRNGAGYGWDCAHHAANLETLCRSCHVVVTNAQRAGRREAGVTVGAAATGGETPVLLLPSPVAGK